MVFWIHEACIQETIMPEDLHAQHSEMTIIHRGLILGGSCRSIKCCLYYGGGTSKAHEQHLAEQWRCTNHRKGSYCPCCCVLQLNLFVLINSQIEYRNEMIYWIAPHVYEILIQFREKVAWKQLLWVPAHQWTVGGGHAHFGTIILPPPFDFPNDAITVYQTANMPNNVHETTTSLAILTHITKTGR